MEYIGYTDKKPNNSKSTTLLDTTIQNQHFKLKSLKADKTHPITYPDSIVTLKHVQHKSYSLHVKYIDLFQIVGLLVCLTTNRLNHSITFKTVL